MRVTVYLVMGLLIAVIGKAVAEPDDELLVNITSGLASVDTLHRGKPVRIERNPDIGNTVPETYARTSRPCPPYCIQPMVIAPGVETLGELELLEYLRRIGERDASVMVIDSREPHWLERGMIPGAVNLPWTLFHASTLDRKQLAELLELQFTVVPHERLWDFSAAKTLVFYCNGPWCGQSPTSIRALLALGYPPERIKWYRGGMQAWLQLGLTSVTP